MFERAVIIGVGMMGGSLGLALRARGVAREVVGVDSDEATLARGHEIGAFDWSTRELSKGVRDADLIVLAAPVRVIPSLLDALVPVVSPDALLTDIGSIKQNIVTQGEKLFGTRFVGGHPMAGSPFGGIEAAQPDLFQEAAWAIVRSRMPDLSDDIYANRVADLALALGARPLLLDSVQHDRLAALVSHLPHLLSFAFADMVAGSADPGGARQMAGGSYRDLMRVSSADRAVWQNIFKDNRVALLQALDAYEQQLQSLRQSLTSE